MRRHRNRRPAGGVLAEAESLVVPAVEVNGLTKTYAGGVEAVKGIRFRVAPGEVFGLLGPNGAGKSTTIGMLTTTIAPTRGTAALAGYDVAEQPLQARSISSVVFQEPVVDRGLTGRANLELHARLWGIDATVATARIAELAEALGVAGILDRAVDGYSGGQRRRLEIARALVSRPRVLFLEEAERLCDRVAIMHAGTIVALDAPAALLAGLGGELLELHVDGDVQVALAALGAHGIAAADAYVVGQTLTVPLHEATAGEAIAALDRARIATGAISTRRPTLDDVYLRLTGTAPALAA